MKLSVIFPVLNSHEAVRRQLLHFHKMNLPDDIEFIIVDDGSNPPLNCKEYILRNLTILKTNDKRPWTQGLARNMGAKHAKGEYLLMTDIDHILPRPVIDAAYNFTGDKMVFHRSIAVLDEDGNLTQDIEVLKQYGYDPNRSRKLSAGSHGNTFAIRKALFHELGGYNPRRCYYGYHAPVRMGEDCYFNSAWKIYSRANGLRNTTGPEIYIFPVGRFNISGDSNPMGLFHQLSYDPVQQPMLE